MGYNRVSSAVGTPRHALQRVATTKDLEKNVQESDKT
jgi:hypothetical protein